MSEQSLEVEQLERLRFPIGPFEWDGEWSTEVRNRWIEGIRMLPEQLEAAVQNLGEDQLNTPYRPGGWTIRQVVHHLADSHMNSYIRFKLALTETNPTIKPYEEHQWAELADSSLYPIEYSLNLLKALHHRWVVLLESLTEEQLLLTFYHPANQDQVPLRRALGTYDWHGRHHLAHIVNLQTRMNW